MKKRHGYLLNLVVPLSRRLFEFSSHTYLQSSPLVDGLVQCGSVERLPPDADVGPREVGERPPHLQVVDVVAGAHHGDQVEALVVERQARVRRALLVVAARAEDVLLRVVQVEVEDLLVVEDLLPDGEGEAGVAVLRVDDAQVGRGRERRLDDGL